MTDAIPVSATPTQPQPAQVAVAEAGAAPVVIVMSAPPSPPAATAVPVVDPVGCAAFRASVWAWEKSKCAALKAVNWSSYLWRALDGCKTIIVAVVVGIISLADSLNGIDLTGVLSLVMPANTKIHVGDVVTLCMVGTILLRLLSNGPVFKRWRARRLGPVDEPVSQ